MRARLFMEGMTRPRKLKPVPQFSQPRRPVTPAIVQVPSWDENFPGVADLQTGELRMLIKNFLPEGCTFIGALPSEGKTLIGLSIAKALTTGRNFLGRSDFSIPEIIPILYLIPESGGRAFRIRCEKFGIPKDTNLFRCRTISEGATPKLSDPTLLEAIRIMKPVVILDTLVRFSESTDENASMQNKQVTNDITCLRQAGAQGVIALHHATKAMREKGMSLETVLRGTGDIAAYPDCVYGMLRDLTIYDKGNGPNQVDIECVKPRDFDPPLPFRLAISRKTDKPGIGQAPGIESVIDADGDMAIVQNNEAQSDKNELLLKLIQEDPAISLKELSEASGLTTWIIRKALNSIGWMKQRGGAKGAHLWARKISALENAKATQVCKEGINLNKVLSAPQEM
jgi:AAA domain-containing protein